MAVEIINCPGCDEEIRMNVHEFVDAQTDPELKDAIINGQFFLTECPNCGQTTLAEYPLMYTDSEKKLNVYMAPDYEPELLDQLNSLDIEDAELDEETSFRLVENGGELLEKILIAEAGRDDRVIELYKAVACENLKEEFPELCPEDMLYFRDEEGEEMFIVFDIENPFGEQLTIEVDPEIYEQMAKDCKDALWTEPGKYEVVNAEWLADRIDVTE